MPVIRKQYRHEVRRKRHVMNFIPVSDQTDQINDVKQGDGSMLCSVETIHFMSHQLIAYSKINFQSGMIENLLRIKPN